MPKIKHIALTTHDVEGTARFYIEVFGMKEIAKIDDPGTRGCFLSDGDINLAILNWKTEKDADVGANGPNYNGIHHFGFEVDDLGEACQKLEAVKGRRLTQKAGLDVTMAPGRHRNFEMKWAGPDEVFFDISHTGWQTLPEEQ